MGMYIGKKKVTPILTKTRTDRLQWKCDNMKSLESEFLRYTGTELSNVLEGLDTSQVENMKNMFNSCKSITNLNVSGLNTGNVVNMSGMFSNCEVLTNINVLNFDTSNVTNMGSMFSSCGALTVLDLSNFDTSNVTDMSSMFSGCGALTSLDLSSFDTSNVKSISNMFFSCRALTVLDLSNFDTSKVTSVSYMFYNCAALETIKDIDLIKVTSTVSFISDCKSLKNLTLKNIKKNLEIGSGTRWGHLLTDESFINTAMELHDLTGATTQTLRYSSARDSVWDSIYVKLITATDEMIANDPYASNKKPCVVCESTDEGAMTLREYAVSKNWTLAKV